MEFDFTDPAFITDPWPVYEKHREDGGVAWAPKVGCYVLTTYSAVREGLTSSKLSANYPLRASRRLLGPNMLDTEGDLHRVLKQLVTPFLSMDAVRRIKDTAVSHAIGETEQFLDSRRECASFDLVSDVAERVPYLIMADILGIPRTDSRWLFTAVRPIVEALDYPLPESSDAAERAKDAVTRYCQDRLGDETTRAGRMTILGSLRRLIAAGELDSQKALSSLLLMIIAATETSISAISNVSYRLLTSGWPRWENGTDLGAYIDESLRLDPPLHSVLRFATDDWSVGGVTVRRRYPVLLVLASANRDRAVFPHPDVFDPARNHGRAVTFGAGSHACPGFRLAHAEFTDLFQRLASRFRVVPAGPAGMIKGHVFRRHPSLPATLNPARQQKSARATHGDEMKS